MTAAATRDAILQAARDLVVEQGLHGTTTAAIARRAGIAVGTLFHHFPGKTELLAALVAETRAHRDASLRAGLDPADPVRDQIRTVFVNHLRWAVDHPERHRFLAVVDAAPNTAIEAPPDADPLGGLVEGGRAAGQLRDLPAALLAAMERELGAALAAHVAANPELADDPAFLDQAFAALWGAIARS